MSREMKYVQQCMGVNGLEKIILREVRGFSAEVSSFSFAITFAILNLFLHYHNSQFNSFLSCDPSFIYCSDLGS